MKVKFIFILILFSSGLLAQSSGRLTLHGKVQHKKSSLNAVFIEVYKDNELIKKIPNLKNGSYKLDLELGHVYNVAFSKRGYIDKSVAVVAKTDSTTRINGRYFFQLDIELFTLDEEGEDESVLPPVAKLYIKDESEGFRYDKKYVRWVAGHYGD